MHLPCFLDHFQLLMESTLQKNLPIINVDGIIEHFTVNEIIERLMGDRIFT